MPERPTGAWWLAEFIVASQSAPRVLLADDSEPVRRTLRALFERRGFTVVEAGDGNEAIRLLDREEPFDLAVLDCKMPGATGPEVYVALRARSQTPVIFITGDSGHMLSELEPDASWLLLGKPFSGETLFEAVERLRRRAA